VRAYVLDASVAAKWFQYEVHAMAARRLLEQPYEMHVPDFFFLEFDNVVCKWIRRNLVSPQQGKNIRAAIRQIPFTIHLWSGLSEAAFDLAGDTKRSLYDCLYLALASKLDLPLVTADQKLYEALRGWPFPRKIIWVEDIS
jgi:predicted nucleic acid-binding protein